MLGTQNRPTPAAMYIPPSGERVRHWNITFDRVYLTGAVVVCILMLAVAFFGASSAAASPLSKQPTCTQQSIGPDGVTTTTVKCPKQAKHKRAHKPASGVRLDIPTRSCKSIRLNTVYRTAGLIYDQASNSFRGLMTETISPRLFEWQVTRPVRCGTVETTHAKVTMTKFPSITKSLQLSWLATPCSDGSPRQMDGTCLVQTPPQVVVLGPGCQMSVDQQQISCTVPSTGIMVDPSTIGDAPNDGCGGSTQQMMHRVVLSIVKHGGAGGPICGSSTPDQGGVG